MGGGPTPSPNYTANNPPPLNAISGGNSIFNLFGSGSSGVPTRQANLAFQGAVAQALQKYPFLQMPTNGQLAQNFATSNQWDKYLPASMRQILNTGQGSGFAGDTGEKGIMQALAAYGPAVQGAVGAIGPATFASDLLKSLPSSIAYGTSSTVGPAIASALQSIIQATGPAPPTTGGPPKKTPKTDPAAQPNIMAWLGNLIANLTGGPGAAGIGGTSTQAPIPTQPSNGWGGQVTPGSAPQSPWGGQVNPSTGQGVPQDPTQSFLQQLQNPGIGQ